MSTYSEKLGNESVDMRTGLSYYECPIWCLEDSISPWGEEWSCIVGQYCVVWYYILCTLQKIQT